MKARYFLLVIFFVAGISICPAQKNNSKSVYLQQLPAKTASGAK
jgi:hypothetical protein